MKKKKKDALASAFERLSIVEISKTKQNGIIGGEHVLTVCSSDTDSACTSGDEGCCDTDSETCEDTTLRKRGKSTPDVICDC